MVANYYLGMVRTEALGGAKGKTGGYKFDNMLIKAIKDAGYPILFGQIRFKTYRLLIAYFDRENFYAGMQFGLEHPRDVALADFVVAIGASLYMPRVIVLPHSETFRMIRYRLKGVNDELKPLYSCKTAMRTILWRKALEVIGKDSLGKRAVVLCYTDSQRDMLQNVFPKAKVVVLPPGIELPPVKGNVNKVYDVVIPITWWKVCPEGLYRVVSKLTQMGLRVLIRDYSNSAMIRNIAQKANAHYKAFSEDPKEYYLDLASAKVALNVSVFETLGFRLVDAIRVGTPVVSLFREWIETVPKLDELSSITAFDYEELLRKQVQETSVYTYDNFIKAFKANFPFETLDKGVGVLSWV